MRGGFDLQRNLSVIAAHSPAGQWIAAFFNTSLSSRRSRTSLRSRVFSFSTSSCGHRHCRSDQWPENADRQIVMLLLLNPFVHVESPTPKSDESWGRVNPLVVAIRTASRRNASVYLFAIIYLLHSKHCSKETGTKT
jgi:hypothetical protein